MDDKTGKCMQQEDAVMKTMMQYFAEELLPYLGIEGNAVSIAPTELVSLEIRKMYQDFNLVMADGTWKHFEFQSTNEGIPGLRRFRSYEALASYQHQVSITTYVLYSGKVKKPVTELTEGVNTYRIVPIIMADKDAGKLISDLKVKIETGQTITKDALIQLALCPLMGGDMEIKERIMAAYAITEEATGIDPEEVGKIEAVIYAMADKFLESVDMEEFKEGMKMTRIGQMLIEEGKREAREEARLEVREEAKHEAKLESAKSLIDLLDERVIAERLGLELEVVRQLKVESRENRDTLK